MKRPRLYIYDYDGAITYLIQYPNGDCEYACEFPDGDVVWTWSAWTGETRRLELCNDCFNFVEDL
jgi:hypothetical protein